MFQQNYIIFFHRGKGNTPEALKLASEIASDLDKLAAQVDKEIDQMVQCGENYNVIKEKLNDAKVCYVYCLKKYLI